jgi:protein-tyrosine phosphatase
MTTVLVVCTGNICRSPIAQGFLRDAFAARFDEAAPVVSSVGTAASPGQRAMPESVTAAAERGSNIMSHVARRLEPAMLETGQADLVVCMAAEHREAVVVMDPEAADRCFTLKELVRILDELPSVEEQRGPETLKVRVAEAAALRSDGFEGAPLDQDIADPLGMPITAYRAVAWELDEWIERLVTGLFGPGKVRAGGSGSEMGAG